MVPRRRYRSSFPFRWIFKIFPSLCLAVAIPFFNRFAVEKAKVRGQRGRSPLPAGSDLTVHNTKQLEPI